MMTACCQKTETFTFFSLVATGRAFHFSEFHGWTRKNYERITKENDITKTSFNYVIPPACLR